eukprot:TRINITY_DN1213_c0_g1_i1.p1 TRINITY_DN1213_c0_g1~~TRINITY_DN1213_c0_g1_i1.p1  ORF type:complete len:172 (-),score=39.13 TRINITY_DN1213_c0_g1_i1:26-541(-)
MFTTWNKKYVIVKNSSLLVYKKDPEGVSLAPTDQYSMENATVVPVDKNRDFCFSISFPNSKPKHFSAESESDMLMWINAITKSSVFHHAMSIDTSRYDYEDYEREITLEIKGMDCVHCVQIVEDILSETEGIENRHIDVEVGLVFLKGKFSLLILMNNLEREGLLVYEHNN